jgi:hypothetical protein
VDGAGDPAVAARDHDGSRRRTRPLRLELRVAITVKSAQAQSIPTAKEKQ